MTLEPRNSRLLSQPARLGQLSAFTFMATTLLCLLNACTKSSNSGLSVSADYINVKGRVIAATDGAGVVNGSVYLGNDGPMAATTDTDGQFSFTISDEQLTQLARSENDLLKGQATGGFQLHIESSNSKLAGLSRTIKFADRGHLDLGDVQLSATGKLIGNVQKLPADGKFQAASGVKVIVGRRTVTTGLDGGFVIDHLPAGDATLFAIGDGYAPTRQDLAVKAGKPTSLDGPIVIFPDNIVAGWVSVLPRGDSQALIAAGHPFQRSFSVSSAPLAQYMRFHHDRAAFDSMSGDAGWRDVTQTINYDFPGSGGHNLFVQFADSDRSRLSSVLTVQAPVDIFDDTDGVVIGDGSGIITRRNADIHISVPRAATRMRMHHDMRELETTPFIAATSVAEYVFLRQREPASGLVTIYVQFADAQNNLSLIYSASAVMNLFPEPASGLFQIEGGAEVTPNRLVRLNIAVPTNAYQMRIFEAVPGSSSIGRGDDFGSFFGGNNSDGDADPTRIWVSVQNLYFHTFETPGLKQLFLQFRDVDGSLSPAYTDTILVQPFEPGGIGFTINGGSPVTTVREVTLSLIPPPGAVAFRFAEALAPVGPAGWITLMPHVPYSMVGRGLRTIYLEYLDANGDRSLMYSQSISVDLFGDFPGAFAINGGATVTDFPVLNLDIEPPLGATQMVITEDPHSFLNNPNVIRDCNLNAVGWRAIAPVATYTVRLPGPKTIFVKFRNETCDETGFIQHTIVYEPFPVLNFGMIEVVAGTVVTSRSVHLVVQVPPRAQFMLISHDSSVFDHPERVCPSDLHAPLASPVITPAILAYELPDRDGDYQIFIRYGTTDDSLFCTSSPRYFSHKITLQRFPSATLQMSLNNGAATTTDPLIQVDFATLPSDAIGVAMSEALDELPLAIPRTIQPSMSFNLTPVLGSKTVWAQYVTSTGSRSPAFSATIELTP